MKIKISEIVKENVFTFDYIETNLEDLTFKDGVKICGKISLKDGKYIVEGNYNTVIKLECVRCLADIERDISGEFKGIFLDSKAYSEYLSNLKPEDEMEDEYMSEAVDGQIDISELVREYIILDLPQYEMCYPECKDSSELDKYSKDEIDPRWQQLLEINK